LDVLNYNRLYNFEGSGTPVVEREIYTSERSKQIFFCRVEVRNVQGELCGDFNAGDTMEIHLFSEKDAPAHTAYQKPSGFI
jgi:hypothetical protein